MPEDSRDSRPLTVREWYEQSKNPPIGADDLLAPRRARICALNFDGVAFGNTFVDEDRYAERDMLANVVVACGVDTEIKGVTTLPVRRGKNTPDFAACLISGETVRVEVTRFADALVHAYMGDLHNVFTSLQEAWRADAAINTRIRGMHVIFYFPSEAPRGHDRSRARDEIMSILRRIDRISIADHYVYEPPDDCQVLRSLGVTWTVRPVDDGDAKVQFRPSLTISDASRAVEAAPVVLASKKSKYSDYSDDGTVAVWLAVFMSDGISGVGLTAIQILSEHVERLEPSPFARLMIANHVAGLTIDQDKAKPAIYQSLSGYRVIAREQPN